MLSSCVALMLLGFVLFAVQSRVSVGASGLHPFVHFLSVAVCVWMYVCNFLACFWDPGWGC